MIQPMPLDFSAPQYGSITDALAVAVQAKAELIAAVTPEKQLAASQAYIASLPAVISTTSATAQQTALGYIVGTSYPTYSYYAVMTDGTRNFIGTGTSPTYGGPNIGGAVSYQAVLN